MLHRRRCLLIRHATPECRVRRSPAHPRAEGRRRTHAERQAEQRPPRQAPRGQSPCRHLVPGTPEFAGRQSSAGLPQVTRRQSADDGIVPAWILPQRLGAPENLPGADGSARERRRRSRADIPQGRGRQDMGLLPRPPDVPHPRQARQRHRLRRTTTHRTRTRRVRLQSQIHQYLRHTGLRQAQLPLRHQPRPHRNP